MSGRVPSGSPRPRERALSRGFVVHALSLLTCAALAAGAVSCRHSGDSEAPPRVDTAAMATVPGLNREPALIDRFPEGESGVSGSVRGTYLDTRMADGVHQAISEGMASEAPPARRYSSLEHRWRIRVAEGRRVELHVRGHATPSLDGDRFAFEYSRDNGSSWESASLPELPQGEADVEVVAPLPEDLSGEILVRVVDTLREPGLLVYDTVFVDRIFIRSIG